MHAIKIKSVTQQRKRIPRDKLFVLLLDHRDEHGANS